MMTRIHTGTFSAAPPSVAKRFPLTEYGNAEHFERECQQRVCYDHSRKQWFVFGPHHWAPDLTGEVTRRAITSVRQRQIEALRDITDTDKRKEALRFLFLSEGRKGIANLLALAQSLESLAIVGDDWDADPMLFGVQNGVIDLHTGTLRRGQMNDRITKVAPVTYDARATCPRFTRFIDEIFEGYPDLGAYVQRVVGYCLTGLTSEQVFWILWGVGANGKSTLIETLQHALFGAAYGWTMPFPTANWSQSMTEYQRAELVGRRVVQSSEVKQRATLHEEFIKSLTGGDTLNARHPYGRPFAFTPCAKFTLRVNHKPVIRDLTHSMWRRVKLVPFTRTFAIDLDLPNELQREAPGILNWALQGCRDWQREGLCEPPCVSAATAEYRQESDPFAEFVGDCCVVMAGVSVGGKALFECYRHWCDQRGVAPEERMSQRTFGEKVKETYPDIGSRTVRYSGIGLLETSGEDR